MSRQWQIREVTVKDQFAMDQSDCRIVLYSTQNWWVSVKDQGSTQNWWVSVSCAVMQWTNQIAGLYPTAPHKIDESLSWVTVNCIELSRMRLQDCIRPHCALHKIICNWSFKQAFLISYLPNLPAINNLKPTSTSTARYHASCVFTQPGIVKTGSGIREAELKKKEEKKCKINKIWI